MIAGVTWPTYRFEAWNGHWSWFRAEYPATASKIASKERLEEAPRAFRNKQPWNLVNKGGNSCLCRSCDGTQKIMLAARSATGLLRELLQAHTFNDEAGLRRAAMATAMTTGVRMQLLRGGRRRLGRRQKRCRERRPQERRRRRRQRWVAGAGRRSWAP